MLRRKKFYVIYPEYFDANLSRSEGRKVPLELADQSAHLLKLVKACDKLGINYQLQKDKAYPSQWWKQSGRLLIPINKQNKIPKHEFLIDIAKVARKFVPKKKKVVKKGKSTPLSTSQKHPKRTASARRRKKN